MEVTALLREDQGDMVDGRVMKNLGARYLQY